MPPSAHIVRWLSGYGLILISVTGDQLPPKSPIVYTLILGGDVLVEGVGLVEHFAEGRRRGGTGVRGE